mmetsp:Transcript_13109/g.28475  ORF Transcript_13109/g.28475 Transcript_13109/m.28475 type:complete len:836 (-) Transcript_13109:2875-5382(-)
MARRRRSRKDAAKRPTDEAITPPRQEVEVEDDNVIDNETESPSEGNLGHLKPLLEVGDEVYSAWWSDEERSGDEVWYPGVIESYEEVENDGLYGPTRMYNVKFDGEGYETDGVEDRFVCPKADYLLSMRNGGEGEWIGVRNVVDEDSTDPWAYTVGWYIATIDGQDQPFSLLSDAVDAHDKAVVQRKGKSTNESDLNLPEKWPELFNHPDAEENIEGDGEESYVVSTEATETQSKKTRRGRALTEAKEQIDSDAAQKEEPVEKEDVNLGCCPHCMKHFSSKNGLRYHIAKKVCQQPKPEKAIKEPEPKQQPKIEDLTCPHCQKVFMQEKRLATHLDKKVCQSQPAKKGGSSVIKEPEPKQQPKIEDLTCPHCQKVFMQEKRLATHLDKKVCQSRPAKTGGSSKKIAETEDPPSPQNESEKPTERRRSTRVIPSKKKPSVTESKKKDPYTDEGGRDNDGDFRNQDKPKKKGKKRKRESTEPSSSPRSKAAKKAAKKSVGRFSVLAFRSKFVTKFGVVMVIADDRLPPDRHKSTHDQTGTSLRSFLKRKERFHEREQVFLDQMAAGTRHRREELKRMYLESKCTSTVPTITQKKVWDLYCKSLTPKQILTEGLSWACTNDDLLEGNKTERFLEDDPRFPKDLYPDRIVECKLVQDNREVIYGTISDDTKSDGTNVFEFHAKEKAKDKKQTVPMRLFIARRELTREYHSSQVQTYVCSHCAKHLLSREAMKYHLGFCLCVTKQADVEEKRHQRIGVIESKALSGVSECLDSLLTNVHSVVTKVTETRVADNPPDFGNPHKIKMFKKHKMPSWLVFNAQRSAMYPEIYMSIGFKRGKAD